MYDQDRDGGDGREQGGEEWLEVESAEAETASAAAGDPHDDESPQAEFDDESREEDEAPDDVVLDEETIREVLRRYVKEAKLIQASRIEPMPVEWLWEGRIPLGQLTLLAGDSGVGKSLIALDLAARVSTGAAWPDEPAPSPPGLAGPASGSQPREPANVLILSAHENLMTTLCSRLERAGADRQRIFFGAGVPLSSPSRWLDHRPIRVPDDFMSLARVFMELAPVKLLILDPAWAFCHRGRGRSRVAGPAQLEELALLAARFKLAIVGVTDLARVNRTHVPYRAAGGRALTAAARVAWGVLRHPRERDRRLLLPLQMTIAKPAAGIEFQIHEERITWDAAPARVTAEAVLAAERAGGDQKVAETWLQAFLGKGGRPSNEIKSQATECGISLATLRRAKEAIGARAQLVHNEGGKTHWNWTLADEAVQDAASATMPDGKEQFARICAAG